MTITNLREALDQKEVEFPVDWDARPDQSRLWRYLVKGGKRAVEVAHRRWGKDDVALHWTCCAAMERVGNYWHMLPEYGQARKVIWTAVNPRTGQKRIDESFPKWIRKNTKEQEMSIEFLNGSLWQLVGSDNFNSLVGSPPIGIVFSEWAIANPLAWAYLSPILEENGGWALFIYTSRGNNHGRTMLTQAQATDGWFAEINPADKTPVFTAAQLEAIHREYQNVFGLELGDALFLQEYFCSFEGAQLGAYYAKQIAKARKDGRITAVPHATGAEVHTAWDLGVDDSMTIWFFQQVGLQYRFIDYYENTGFGLEHYAKVLKDKPYVYGNHFMPHDADVREMSSGTIAKSRKEVAENLGIKPIVVVQRAQNIDIIMQIHIPAVRNIMSQCWWDEKKCATGLSALESYAADYDDEKKVLKNRPAHNWASHGADGFRTFAVGYREVKKAGLPPAQNLAKSYAVNIDYKKNYGKR
jgi:phage terminase large subunit